ncbi:MAG: hypothetical protein ABR887_04195 [Methanoregulaceae archaeon]|jgi:hypothetical protein
MQNPLQNISPPLHVHRPLTQDCPCEQVTPHAPQLPISALRSRQNPAQLVRPSRHDPPCGVGVCIDGTGEYGVGVSVITGDEEGPKFCGTMHPDMATKQTMKLKNKIKNIKFLFI